MTPIERAVKAMTDALDEQGALMYTFGGQFENGEAHKMCVDSPGVDARIVVRAILTAIREPTNEMSREGGEIPIGAGDGGIDYLGTHAAEEVWQAMIDAALAEEGVQPC